MKLMLQGQLPDQESVAGSIESSETTDSIFRPGVEHKNRTKQILALFEEQKMCERVDKLKYELDCPVDNFVGYMERRLEERRAFWSKLEENNSLISPKGMSEGLHPEVRRIIEERMQNKSA
jgi:hypothetical protein